MENNQDKQTSGAWSSIVQHLKTRWIVYALVAALLWIIIPPAFEGEVGVTATPVPTATAAIPVTPQSDNTPTSVPTATAAISTTPQSDNVPTPVPTATPTPVVVVAPDGTSYGTDNIAYFRAIVTEMLACIYSNALRPDALAFNQRWEERFPDDHGQWGSSTQILAEHHIDQDSSSNHWGIIDNYINRIMSHSHTVEVPELWTDWSLEDKFIGLKDIACE